MLSLFALLALLSPAHADTPIEGLPAELQARFLAAETAWETGDLGAAEAGFVEITRAAPTFDRAWRRLCGVVLAADRPDDALPFCQEAVNLVASLENRTALAIAYIETDALEKGGELAEAAASEAPDFVPAQVALCAWARSSGEDAMLKRCSTRLDELAPNTAGTLYYQSLRLASEGAFEDARFALEVASSKGLTDDLVRDALQELARRKGAEPKSPRPGGDNARRSDSSWTLGDLLPLGLGAALVLAIGVLAFGKEDDPTGNPPSSTEPPAA